MVQFLLKHLLKQRIETYFLMVKLLLKQRIETFFIETYFLIIGLWQSAFSASTFLKLMVR